MVTAFLSVESSLVVLARIGPWPLAHDPLALSAERLPAEFGVFVAKLGGVSNELVVCQVVVWTHGAASINTIFSTRSAYFELGSHGRPINVECDRNPTCAAIDGHDSHGTISRAASAIRCLISTAAAVCRPASISATAFGQSIEAAEIIWGMVISYPIPSAQSPLG